MPNSAPCLMALMVSAPALASPMTLALELWAWSRDDERLVLLSRDLVDREHHRRRGHVDDDVHLVGVEPLPCDRRADVRLVLMVGDEDLDLHPLLGGAEVLDGHPGGHHRAGTGEVG